jgi:hypothetical protein
MSSRTRSDKAITRRAACTLCCSVLSRTQCRIEKSFAAALGARIGAHSLSTDAISAPR